VEVRLFSRTGNVLALLGGKAFVRSAPNCAAVSIGSIASAKFYECRKRVKELGVIEVASSSLIISLAAAKTISSAFSVLHQLANFL